MLFFLYQVYWNFEMLGSKMTWSAHLRFFYQISKGRNTSVASRYYLLPRPEWLRMVALPSFRHVFFFPLQLSFSILNYLLFLFSIILLDTKCSKIYVKLSSNISKLKNYKDLKVCFHVIIEFNHMDHLLNL